MIGDLFDITDEDTTKYSLPDKYQPSSRIVVGERSNVGFVGLFNQGATCYLNSLIQALYMTPELRKGIYELTKEELGLEEDEKPQREESPPLPAPERMEVEDNNEEDEWADKITELIEMGFSRALAVKALRTTKENGNICINRSIEWLFIPGNSEEPSEVPRSEVDEKDDELNGNNVDQSNNDNDNIFESNDKPKKLRKKRRKIPIELQMLFSELQLADKMSVSTNRLTDSFGWSGKDIGQQHDVHELNRVLFDAIEASLKKTKSESLLNKLYRGSMVNKVQCIACGRVSEREESYQDVTVMVGKMTSLRESLQHFVLPENLDGDNQYFCEQCGEKRDAKRWVCFRQLPPILIFSLSRFEYDFDNDRRIKNCNHFHYPLTIDLAPYHETANSDHTSTSSNVSFDSPVSPHSIPLFDPSVDSSSSDQLYDLFGVIIHTGNSGEYGHYHAYIKDLCHQGSWDASVPDREEREEESEEDEDAVPLDTMNSPPPTAPPTTEKNTSKAKKSKEDVDKGLEDNKDWYDFNDSHITPIPITRLRKQFGGRNECAYMLIYRNRSSLPPPAHPLSVPDHLLDFIATENAIAKEEREEYERLNNQIRIHVYAPDHFFVDEDGIARVLPIDASQSPDSIDTKISFNIDQRLYSSYIKQNIKIMMNEDYLRGCEDPELMQLLSISITKEGVLVARTPLSDDKSIKASSLYNGDQLLVWNGFHINRSEWNPSNRLISVDLKYISINSDPSLVVSTSEDVPMDDFSRIPIDISTYQLEIATCTSIHKFKQQLTELTSIPADLQLLSIVSKKYTSFEDDLEEQHEITILHEEEEGEGGKLSPLTFANYIQYLEGPTVSSQTFLSVERIPDRYADLSLLPSIQRDQKYQEISLVGKFLQIQKTRTQVFVVDQISLPHQTLYFLLEKTTTLFELKVRALKQIGSQLDPDFTRLRRASVNFQGLYQNESVSIDDAGISNFCKVILEEGESPSSQTITIRFRVHPNKDVLPIAVNRSWSVLQMRSTMMEKVGVEGDYLIRRTDFWGHPTSIVDDERMVGNAGVHPDDLLVLEAGKAPVKGQFLLNLKLFEFAYTDDPSSSPLGDQMETEEAEQKKEGEKKRKWYLYSPGYVMVKDAPRAYKVTDLNSITISSSASLGELKEAIYQQYGRDLSAQSAHHIRVWLRPQIIRNNDKLLREYYIGNNTSLILQTVPEVDQSKGMQEVALLWVFVRKYKQFAKPVEYLYHNNLRFDKSLFDCISEDFAIPAEHLIVGKYFPSSNSWQIIDADDEETTSEASSNAPSSEIATEDIPKEESKKKKGNFYFKDGDIIAVKDKRLDENEEDNFMSQMVTLPPARAHVKYAHSTAQKRPEAELRIHVDDYDCEYESDDTPIDQN